MRCTPTHRDRRRSGAVLAQVALAMTALAGVLAVVLDGGMMLTERRRAQAVADAGAMAAAADLFARYLTSGGVDSGSAATSATTTVNANGYTSSNSTTTIRLNPANYLGGPNAGKQVPVGYAEVTVTYNQARFFSALWGSSAIPVTARAVARGQWVNAKPAILVLDPTASGALDVTGGGNIAASNGDIIVNSNSSSGITTSGSKSIISDSNDPILASGAAPLNLGSGTVNPTPTPGQTPTPDPLRFLPFPSPKPADAPAPTTSNGVTTYYPGYYASGLNLTGGYTAVFQSGTYYMDGTFKVNGNGSSSLTGSGVMIVIGPNGSLNLGGNGSVTLSPLTSGIYQGISVFQSRSNTSDMQIAGSGSFNISGTLYAAKATMKVAGNGDNIASQIISNQLLNNGGGNSGTINVTWNGSNVAKTRVFNLVE
jgi:hypothetical protein